MKKYLKMKDSEVEWIGEIPKEWDLKSIKRLGKIVTGNTPSTKNEKNFGGDFLWAGPDDLDEEMYVTNTNTKLSEQGFSLSRKIPSKSVMVSCIGYIGKVGISQNIMSTNQQINSIICENDNPEFVFYYIKSIKDVLTGIPNKTVVPIINKDDFSNFKISLPKNFVEQKKIAEFLNKKVLAIDNNISKYQKLINLFSEKRQETINNIIKNGLNASTQLEESGFKWIGKIPKHWKTNKIKFSAYVKGRIGWQGLHSDELVDEGPYLITGTDFEEGGIDWRRCYHVTQERYEQDSNIQIKNEDLLITKDGTIGKLAYIKHMPDVATLNSHLLVIRPLNKKFTNRFMYWVLQSNQFEYFTNIKQRGTTFNALSQEMIENFAYPVPPLNEQKIISEYIDNKTNQIDEMSYRVSCQIKKLKELRQSLISSAVTGKIDVREAVA